MDLVFPVPWERFFLRREPVGGPPPRENTRRVSGRQKILPAAGAFLGGRARVFFPGGKTPRVFPPRERSPGGKKGFKKNFGGKNFSPGRHLFCWEDFEFWRGVGPPFLRPPAVLGGSPPYIWLAPPPFPFGERFCG